MENFDFGFESRKYPLASKLMDNLVLECGDHTLQEGYHLASEISSERTLVFTVIYGLSFGPDLSREFMWAFT